MYTNMFLNFGHEFFDDKRYALEKYCEMGNRHLRNMYNSYADEFYGRAYVRTADTYLYAQEWFLNTKIDLYLVQNAKHMERTVGFVGWLHDTFGLNCIVNTDLWNQRQQMENDINSRVNYLQYENECRVAEHTSIYTAMCAERIMDRAEAVIYLNLDKPFMVYNGGEISKFYTPWVYYEKMIGENMKRRSLQVYRDEKLPMDRRNDSINAVTVEDVRKWEIRYRGEKYPLDVLYNIKGI